MPINVLAACLVLYPLARYVDDGLSKVVLAVIFLCTALLYLLGAQKAVSLLGTLPLAALGAAAFSAYSTGNSESANYLILSAVYIGGMLVLLSQPRSYCTTLIIAFVGVVIIANVAAALGIIEGIRRISATDLLLLETTQKTRAEVIRLHTLLGLGWLRATGIFVHANEMGIYMAGAFCILAQRLVDLRRPTATLVIMMAMSGALVIVSGSFSALLICALVGLHLVSRRVFALASVTIVAFLAVTQLFLPNQMAELLGSGSFWWRYLTADRIVELALPMSIAPDKLDVRGSWPHSLVLDLVAVFGWAGVALFGLLAYVVVRLIKSGSTSLLLLAPVVLLQPVGAMPSSMFMMLLAVGMLADNRVTAARTLSEPRVVQT